MTAAGSVVFWVAAVVAVLAAAAVFRVNSMARATYALALSFVAVGVAVLVLHLDFIGVITILMMVMEMAIMAVFMVSYMGMNPALMPMDMTHSKRTAGVLAAVVFAGLAAAVILTPWPARHGVPAADLTRALGNAIMGPQMLVMLTISPVLFATIIAALVLANPRGRYDRYGDQLRQPPNDPERGGIGR